MPRRIDHADLWFRTHKTPSSLGLAGGVPVAVNDVWLGEGSRLAPFVNLYDCSIGVETRIGAFVEIQAGVNIGDRCKIGSHSFICSGVTIENNVFIGHGVMFCNDRHPRAVAPNGEVAEDEDWKLEPVHVCEGASIGTGAVILPGITIGKDAVVGAGAVVTHDVVEFTTVLGVPARRVGL